MSRPRRSALPDNLDPLVDTLSNVVGILVIVIALTQLELGDAVARVARELADRSGTPPIEAIDPPDVPRSPDPELAVRRERLRDRGIDDLASARRTLERAVAGIESSTAESTSERARAAPLSPRAREALEARVARAREALAAEEAGAVHRRAYAKALETVPKRLVARLPDPRLVEGREAWILVRYGRVYPVEREALFEQGRQAVTKIVPDGATRSLRPDELASVAHYLRKSDIGLGLHRWQLETEPALHMVLSWRTRDGGIERSRVGDDPGLTAWLARHDPAAEAIRFHVWSDSFETYLEARERVEAAGFRAGWRGHEADEELAIGLRFGMPEPEVRPREVD